MCFEKQHVRWLLETHVAFRGRCGAGIFVITGISFGATPRLDLAGTAVEAHIVNHAKNSHAHGGQNRAEGGREEPSEPRLHGVGDEAAGKVGAHRHEEGVGDDDADRAGLVAFSPGALSGTQGVTQVQGESADDDSRGEGTVKERARGERCGAYLGEEVEEAHHGVGVAEDGCGADGEG